MHDDDKAVTRSIGKVGYQSRRARLVEHHSGGWASSSQAFVHLAADLYGQSIAYARSLDGNCSPYSLAGIPMLLAALRAFLIELYSGIFTGEMDEVALGLLASHSTEADVLRSVDSLPGDLSLELDLLFQVRHEILHPAHRPGPEPDGAPAYLRRLKRDGLLQSTGTDQDYTWIAQLQSHRLFRWGFLTVARIVDRLISIHNVHEFPATGLRHSYYQFQSHDTA